MTPFKFRQAVHHLRQGGIVAYPTEAVFGLGCEPLNEQAVLRILELKRRPMAKGLILIASSIAQIEPYLLIDKTILERISPTWPGPVTWLIPAQSWVPIWLTGKHKTLAVRVTAHPVVKALCAEYGGPIVSTSANPAGKPPATSAFKVIQYFSTANLAIINAATDQLEQTTAIFNASDGRRLR